ncbi:hypothetical protein R75777_08096 [Paraburkholderia nemoris]|nr:hypothetical protein R75777_08096 [Paraburkholderia nemoris]
MVRKPVEQRRRHLCISKHTGPLSEAQVGGNDDAGSFVELAEQVEQHGAAGLAERQIAEFVENHKIGIHESRGELSGLAHELLLFERIDQLDGGEEAHTASMVLESLHTDRGCQMGLSSARSTYQNDVVRGVDELTLVQLAHQRFVGVAAAEVEAADVAIRREACRLHLIRE